MASSKDPHKATNKEVNQSIKGSKDAPTPEIPIVKCSKPILVAEEALTAKETPIVKNCKLGHVSEEILPTKGTPVVQSANQKQKSVKEQNKETPVIQSAKHQQRSIKEQKSAKEQNKEVKPLNLKELIKRHLQAGACKMNYELAELHQLLDLAKVSMQRMPTLVELSAPINICGKSKRQRLN
jgi:hypothetical protein